jgi:hypothetical protein
VNTTRGRPTFTCCDTWPQMALTSRCVNSSSGNHSHGPRPVLTSLDGDLSSTSGLEYPLLWPVVSMRNGDPGLLSMPMCSMASMRNLSLDPPARDWR